MAGLGLDAAQATKQDGEAFDGSQSADEDDAQWLLNVPFGRAVFPVDVSFNFDTAMNNMKFRPIGLF